MQEEFYLELKEGLLEPLAVTERLAIISVVGDGMRTLRGISAKFFAALARANINIVAIAQGSSERSISVVVNNDDATTGVRVTHQMLFNTDQVIEVFVIGVGGVGGALLEQLKRTCLRRCQLEGSAYQCAWPKPGKLAGRTGASQRAV